jgi:succinate dehydrogenase hydrophobic anchor subunit
LDDKPATTRSGWFWLYQRVSGAILGVLLIAHVLTMHIGQTGNIDSSQVLTRVSSSGGWALFYALFFLLGISHGLSGLWAIIRDMRPSPVVSKVVLAALWVFGAAFSVYAAFTLAAFHSMGGAA